MPQIDFMLPSALVQAGAYAPDHATAPAEVFVPAEVLADIRRARVQLYCSQDIQAVAAIRAARERLRCSGSPPQVVALQALDAASWLARHGHTFEAEEALEAALARLEAVGGRA